MNFTNTKKIFLLFLFILLINFSFSSVAAEPTVKWRLGGVHGVTTPETIGLNYFAELVEEKTDGEMVVEIYPAGQLGDEVSMIENTIIGAQEMFANVMDWNQHIVKDYGIFAMTFAFSDVAHINRFFETEKYQQMEEEMIDQGVRILAKNWYRLPRAIVTKFPVFTIDDLKGHTFRMPALETYFLAFEQFGVNPVEIPWAEAYSALERGIGDGMDSPIGSIYGMGFYKVAPFITNTRHMMAPFNLLVSERAYQSLSPELREKLTEAAHEAGEYYTNMLAEEFENDKQKMLNEGAVYVEISTKEFAERSKGLAADFEKKGLWSEGLFEYIQNL
ncbi:MAG: TRAP transporter substrate-binding protein [Atribacterota bacterium]|jgi:tripartite ATP-independent transporter DctP family solute receptor|nr:TRAP transporter substrate-binding protein [Atribacterota bacterium]